MAVSGLQLAKPELPKTKEPTKKPVQPIFQKQLPKYLIELEFARKVAIECGKRCMMHRMPKPSEVEANPALAKFLNSETMDDLIPNYQRIKMSPGEEVCVNRCIAKLENVRELVDKQLMEGPFGSTNPVLVEMPPILYNQNLP